MKVDVLHVSEIEIGKFRWWSKWVDVAVFNYGSTGYLLQMRISRTNRKKFNCAPFKRGVYCAGANIQEAGDLIQMKS